MVDSNKDLEQSDVGRGTCTRQTVSYFAEQNDETKVGRPTINTHRVEGEHGVSILLGLAPDPQGITTDTVDPVENEKPKRGRPAKDEVDP